MDAFYASVEIRDNPSYRGTPLIIGGDPKSRGVVSTCSYEARKFGVHSAMPTAEAHRRCPDALFLYPDMPRYKKVSQEIRDILNQYSDIIEPLSLDEAYLDVTEDKRKLLTASETARQILWQIRRELHLSASAGVASTKFTAKLASDQRKPGGLTVVPPGTTQTFVSNLPVTRFFGIGKVTANKMNKMNIHFGKDILACSQEFLVEHFGSVGNFLYNALREKDDRKVKPHHHRKSVSRETTFATDVLSAEQLEGHLRQLSERVSEDLKRLRVKGRSITLKLRYADFQIATRSLSFSLPTDAPSFIFEHGQQLLQRTEAGKKRVRLIGIGLSKLTSTPEPLLWNLNGL